VLKVEKIDTTEIMKKSGIHKNLSSWRNFYKNIIVSCCVEIGGEWKQYDYKFYFTEEKLDKQKIQELEKLTRSANSLKKKLLFEEAKAKINQAREIIKEDNDPYFNRILNNLYTEISKAEEEYLKKLEDFEQFRKEVEQLESDKKYEDALKFYDKLKILAKKLKKHDLVKNYAQKIEELQIIVKYLKRLDKIKVEIINNEKSNDFEKAIENCRQIIKLAEEIGQKEVIQEYSEKISYLNEKLEKRKKEEEELRKKQEIKKQIEILENEIIDDKNTEQYEKVIEKCEKIIELANQIGSDEIKTKYTNLINEINKLIEQKQQEAAKQSQKQKEAMELKAKFQKKAEERLKEQEFLIEKAKQFNQMITIAKDTVPIIEELSITDVLGDLSGDIKEMSDKISGLIEEHRVEIKEEITSNALLTSISGEVKEIEKEIKVNETKNDNSETIFNVQSIIENPFDDILGQAIISHLIPYNFEILNVEFNGEKVMELHDKRLTKDGLEINWEINDVSTQEKIELNYNLRKRISRTIIYVYENQVKIIKTHFQIEESDPQKKGFYKAIIPFNNIYDTPINGLIIEDIVPLHYLHIIKEPLEYHPKENKTHLGNIIKWNIGKFEPSLLRHYYIFLELFLFEELKNNVSELDEEGFQAIMSGDFSEAKKVYNNILELIEFFIK